MLSSQISVLKEYSAYNEMGGETTPSFRILRSQLTEIQIHSCATIVCIDVLMKDKVGFITTSVALDPFLLSK